MMLRGIAVAAALVAVKAQPSAPSAVSATGGDRSIRVDFTPTDAGQATSYQIYARVQHPFPLSPAPTLTELPGTGDEFTGSSLDPAAWDAWTGSCTGQFNSTTSRAFPCWNNPSTQVVNGSQLIQTAFGLGAFPTTTYSNLVTATAGRSDMGWAGAPIAGYRPINVTSAGGQAPFAVQARITRAGTLGGGLFTGVRTGFVVYDTSNTTTPGAVGGQGPRPLLWYSFYQTQAGSFGYLQVHYVTGTTGTSITVFSTQVFTAAVMNPPIDLWLLRDPAAGTWQFGYQFPGDNGPTMTSTRVLDSQIAGWRASPNPLTFNNWRIGITTQAPSASYNVQAAYEFIKVFPKASLDFVASWSRYWADRSTMIARLGQCAASRDVTATVRAPATFGVVGSLLNGVNYTVSVAAVAGTTVGAASTAVAWARPSMALPPVASASLRLLLDANSLPEVPFNGSVLSQIALPRWDDMSGADTSGTGFFEQTSAALRPLVLPRGAGRPFASVTFDGARFMQYVGNQALHRFDTPTPDEASREMNQMNIFLMYRPAPPNSGLPNGMVLSNGLSISAGGESGWHVVGYTYWFYLSGTNWKYPFAYGARAGVTGANTADFQANVGGSYGVNNDYGVYSPHPHGASPTLVTYSFTRAYARVSGTRSFYQMNACVGLNRGLASDVCSQNGNGVTATAANPWISTAYWQGSVFAGSGVAFPIAGFAPPMANPLTVGAYVTNGGSTVSGQFVGDVHAVAIYRGNMTQPEQMAVQSFLMNRYFQTCPAPIMSTGVTGAGCAAGVTGAVCAPQCDTAPADGLRYTPSGGNPTLRCVNGGWSGKALTCGASCPMLNTPSTAGGCTKFFYTDAFESGYAEPTNYSSLGQWDSAPQLASSTGDRYWTVTGGRLVATLPSADDACSPLDPSGLFLNNPGWLSSVTLVDPLTTTADIVLAPASRAGLLFRVLSNTTYYRLTMREGTSEVRLEAVVNNALLVRNWTWRVPAMTFAAGSTYNLRVWAQARSSTDLTARIMGWVNGTQVFSVNDTAIPSGASGVFADSGTVTFDNFAVSGNCDNQGASCRNMFNRMECRYTCANGTRPAGNDRMTCGAGGQYLTAMPDCVPLPPTFPSVRVLVSEAATSGSIFATLNGTAAGPNQIVLFSIDPANNNEVMRDRNLAVRGFASDVFAINVCSGELRLNRNGVLSYQYGSREFYLNVSACPNGRNDSCTYAAVTVEVLQALQAPVWDMDPVSGSTSQYVRYVRENVPSGTLLDRALGDTVVNLNGGASTNVFAITFGDPTGIFAINPSSGQLSVNRSGVLNFEATRVYNLLVSATDSIYTNFSSTMLVQVMVNDTNDAPILPPLQTFQVLENQAITGAIAATLTGYDEDAGDVATWVSAPAPNPNVVFETDRGNVLPNLRWATNISSTSWRARFPVPSVVDDLLVRTVLTFNVSMQDTRGAVTSAPVKIYVLVNVDAASTDPLLQRVTYNLSVGAPGLPTDGGLFSLIGRNFDALGSAPLVTMLYPNANDPTNARGPYVANCSLQSAAELRCMAPPGYGANLTVQVLRGGTDPVAAERAILLSYRAPVITGLQPLRAVNGTALTNLTSLQTTGGEYFWVLGTNLWAPGAPIDGTEFYYGAGRAQTTYIAFTYTPQTQAPGGFGGNGLVWPSLNETDDFVASSRRILVRSVDGMGGAPGMVTQVRVGNQLSPVYSTVALTLRYGPPVITGVSTPQGSGYALNELSIFGGQDVLITGYNFGPATYLPKVRYGNKVNQWLQLNGNETGQVAQFMYNFVNCRKDPIDPHRRITCATSRGMGVNMRVYMNTAAITASVDMVSPVQSAGGFGGGPPQSFLLNYSMPNVTSVSGPGSRAGDTEGGTAVSISGYNLCLVGTFGDLTYTGNVRTFFSSLTYGGTTNRDFFLRSCVCASETPVNTINCVTAPGVGRNLHMRVSVAGSASQLVNNAVSYSPPIITAYAVVPIGRENLTYPLMELPTTGGVRIRITGRNFGPAISSLSAVSYFARLRSPNTEWGSPTPFAVTTDVRKLLRYTVAASATQAGQFCRLSIAHRELICNTTFSAGTDLIWSLTVGLQDSAVPATSYGAPVVTALTRLDGSPMNNADTEGDDVMRITGRNFGPGNTNCNNGTGPARRCYGYVQSLRFGPAGNEFLFSSFSVIDHTTINAWLPPGYGRNLRVTVLVADQLSRVNQSVGFSFAPPTIERVAPLRGPTNAGTTTALRVLMTVSGRNWGLLDPTSTVSFQIGNPSDGSAVAVLAPISSWPDPNDPVSIARFRALPFNQRRANASFFVPIGLLPGRAVRVMTYPVGSTSTALRQYSDPIADSAVATASGGPDETRFDYNAPVVTGHILQTYASYVVTITGGALTTLRNIYARFTAVEQPLVRVLSLTGTNFGPSTATRPDTIRRLVEGTSPNSSAFEAWPYQIYTWDHTRVVVLTTVQSGTVRIAQIGRTFEGADLASRSNTRDFLSYAPSVTRIVGTQSGFNTTGGDIVTVEVQYLGTTATNLTVTVGQVGTPGVDGFLPGRPCALVSRLGADIVSPTAAKDEFTVPANYAFYTTLGAGQPEQNRLWRLRCRLPPMEGGRGVPLVVFRDNDYSATTAVAAGNVWVNAINYQPVRLTAITVDDARRPYVAGSTDQNVLQAQNALTVWTNGSIVSLEGSNFGNCPVMMLYNGTGNGNTPGGRWYIGDIYSCPYAPAEGPFLTRLGDVSHSSVTFIAPEGSGVRESVYFAQINSVRDGNSNWQNVTGSPSQPTSLGYREPLLTFVTPSGTTRGGDVITVRGFNLGPSWASLTINIGPYQCDNGVRTEDHFEAQCVLPEGRGANLTVTARVSGQTSTIVGNFSYLPPRIDNVTVWGDSEGMAGTVFDMTLGWLSRASGPTQGGFNVTLAGDNFGAYDSRATCMNVAWRGRERQFRTDGFQCNNRLDFLGEGEVPQWAVQSWDHGAITFLFPPGAGLRDLMPWVGNQGPASFVTWRYSAPVITRELAPRLGSTEGGDMITMTGANFGRAPRVLGFASGPATDAALADALAARLPSNEDDYLSNPSLPQEMVRVSFFRSCVSSYFDAAGNRPTTITACNSTGIAFHNDTQLSFFSSPGIGVNRSVLLSVIDKDYDLEQGTGRVLDRLRDVTISSVPVNFSYLPPEVTQVVPHPVKLSPRTRAVCGDEEDPEADDCGPKTYSIKMLGLNFGRQPKNELTPVELRWTDEEARVAITVGEFECFNADRDDKLDSFGRPMLRCDMPDMTVGYTNMTYMVAGQTGFTPNTSYAAVFTGCEMGWFGRPGEFCLPCPFNDAVPAGASCDGFNEQLIIFSRPGEPPSQSELDRGTHTYPRPAPGFFNLNSSDRLTSDRMYDACPDSQMAKAPGRDVCIVPCEPVEACLGDNYCATGYRSKAPYYRCASCDLGYFRRANECIKCPDSPYMLVVGFTFLVSFIAGGAYILNKKKINIAFASIAIDYFQVLAIFALSKVPWPPAIKELFHLLSAFNLNIEIVAPECLVPDVSYKQKWSFVMALPVAVGVFFLIIAVSSVVWKKHIKGRKINMSNELAALGSSVLLLMYVLYIYLTRTVLEIFNCTPTTPDDGKMYLTAVFEECGIPGGTQMTLMPFAAVAVIMYVAGYPIGVAILLNRNKDLIMEDQLLRAKGVGDDRLTNPNAYVVRKRFSRIYYQFKPDNFFWVLAIVFRKFCIAATYILFNKNASFQLAAALLIIFLAYAAQLRTSPYMSPANWDDVMREHVQASYTSAVHARLRATIASIESRGRKKAHKNLLRGDGKVDASAVLGMLTTWLFDYNTVEGVMLFSAAIICLMGIMFSAQKKASTYYSDARDALTAVVIAVAVISIIYIVTVIVAEIYILWTEDQRRKALAKKAAAAKKVEDAGGVSAKKKKRSSSGGAPKEFQAGDVNNAMNPMFMTAGGPSAGAATDTNAAAEAIRSMVNPPPTVELWQVYKDTFMQLQGRLGDLKTQLDTFAPEVKSFVASEGEKAAKAAAGADPAAPTIRVGGATSADKAAALSSFSKSPAAGGGGGSGTPRKPG